MNSKKQRLGKMGNNWSIIGQKKERIKIKYPVIQIVRKYEIWEEIKELEEEAIDINRKLKNIIERFGI